MKHLVHLVLLALLIVGLADTTQAQWSCPYATYDDDVNGTGHNTMSVGVMGEDAFVALVMSRGIRSFLIPYVDADSAQGLLYDYGYGSATADLYQIWTDGGFDQAQMLDAMQVVVDKDNYIYVSSNDANRNVLVFRFQDDTIKTVAVPGDPSVFPRQETGSNSIYGLAVDDNGYVYVCNDTSTGVSDDLKIYAPISQWSAFHTDTPVNTIDLPDGVYKGMTVNPEGDALWVCDYSNRTILRFIGSPTGGYVQDNSFSFTLMEDDTIPTTPNRPGPIGLTLLQPNNILVAAVDSLFHTPGIGYQYARIYLLNPNTGDLVDPDLSVSRIDVAAWNFEQLGSFTNRVGGTVPGNASGYASTYDVAADAAGNLYSLSYYGWTVEKWAYEGSLPVVTSVEEIPGELPAEYGLSQNYPNPFNPATTIEFSVPEAGFVSLRIYDLLGKEMKTLVNDERAPGSYRVTFEASDLPSGTYFYTLRAGSHTQTKKMILMK
jgi:sugar lactone lactonase YvrE